MKEETKKVVIQRDIIDKIVKHLSSLGNDMYYASTINICHEIHGVIQSGKFISKEEKDIVGHLDAKDIQSLISYSSNCC
jgi:hypothetical protein